MSEMRALLRKNLSFTMSDELSSSAQRDVMRDLYRVMGDMEDAVCLAYMDAEKTGQVPRPIKAIEMTPGTYARALWRDRIDKGWIRSSDRASSS